MTWCRLSVVKLWTCLLAVLCLRSACDEPGNDQARSNVFHTGAHFISDDKRLEMLPVETRSVRSAKICEASDHCFIRHGWIWRGINSRIAGPLSGLREACLTAFAGNAPGVRVRDCALLHFKAQAGAAELLRSTVHGLVTEAVLDGLQVECTSPERWVIFERHASSPQNMHYDTAATEAEPCAQVTPAAPSGQLSIRVWMPLGEVDKAPMLIANTTWLYPNACAKQSAAKPGQSTSWRIFSKNTFIQDCMQAHDPLTCTWFHTLGMMEGEALLFRNDVVIHGSARVGGAGTRVSLAIDCHTAPSKTEL
eukprot:TRINITY_DN46857_c0_g1_i1.p1 TRINITY_DN46857_c0_g1~~TRINITY_DN46857_c0_g1_i1.p1  ORF type:complete len:308 (+),score=25.97 TRINITY_DN46857_c0_g1_i1:49-972(+)